MSKYIQISIILLILLVLGIFLHLYNQNRKSVPLTTSNFSSDRNDGDSIQEFKFKNSGLKTNTAKLAIPFDKILGGGPSKDGIPSLVDPKFTNIADANKNIKDDFNGIVVTVKNVTKFYPYNILVWHEIVNDIVNGKPLLVTFCPLCGSAIVFDAEIHGSREQFGVSGKLYESNLLMYDKTNESLWSQALGKAVVGDRTGEILTIYPSQVVTYKIFKEKWPLGQVLSTNTGYSRDYTVYPYGNYDNTDTLLFPVSISDTRYPTKEIMFVVRAYDRSVAFPINHITELTELTVDVGGNKISAIKLDREIVVTDVVSGKNLPGYHEMWFSWATHHQNDGVVWRKL